MKRHQRAGFFGPNRLQNHTNEGNGKERNKERGERNEEKRKNKIMVALLVFIMAILAEKKRKEKKLLDAKVFKNPGSYIFSI